MTGCGLRPSPPEPLAVKLAAVSMARFSDAIDTVSTLEAYELVQLAAQASGRRGEGVYVHPRLANSAATGAGSSTWRRSRTSLPRRQSTLHER